MAFQFIGDKTYICTTTDVKLGGSVGSVLFEFNVATGARKQYQTYDGTNWVEVSDNVGIQIGGSNVNNTNPLSVMTPKSNIIFPTTIATVSATPTLLAAANEDRIQISIQNNGVLTVLIKYNGEPTITDYNCSLSVCAANRDGRGGSLEDNIYTGAIYGVTESGTTIVSITEISKQT